MLHQIGIGALGPVYRTYEPTRDRLVAVKVFRLDIVPEQAQALATALGRAASSSLFHPSIVEPIAAGVEGTLAYRAEEYVAAESLDVAMRHYAPATVDKVLPFITQLAGAIDFARAAGVGHGGLHPRDIFMTPDEARATGFGVIEALEEVGIRAPVRRPYTAPERIEGTAWSTPADVFSLAAITFELLTGRRPAGMGTLMGSLPEGERSAALHAVLARAMDPDPAQRYGGALAFAAALESAFRGLAEVPSVAAIAPPAAAAKPKPTPPPVRESVVEPEPEPHPRPAPVPQAHKPEPPPAPEPVPEPTLFDAAEEPLAAASIEHFADDFVGDRDPRALFARHEPEPVEPITPKEPIGPDEPAEPFAESPVYDAPDSSRPAVLPTAIGLVFGLLAGFAGGYFVGSRDRLSPDATTAAASSSTAAPAPATRDQPGQYSEQKVTPPPAVGPASTPAAAPGTRRPTEAPPVVSEGEPARGAAPREAPPPAARERARTTGTIVLKSTPSRAGVMLNGAWRGRTPLTLDRMAFGKYLVRIVQPGYRVAEDEFTLGAHDPEHMFTAKLEATPAPTAAKRAPAPGAHEAPAAPVGGFVGSLYVDSRPRGATVLLDGKNIGITPLSLDNVQIGSHVVRIEMAGKRSWSSGTRVVAGETARVTGSLEDK